MSPRARLLGALRLHGLLAALLLDGCLLSSCAGEGQPLLSEMEAYSGPVRITRRVGDRETVLDGDLHFVRRDDEIRLERRGPPTSRLSKRGDGPLRVVDDGRERPATDADLRDFQLLWMAVHGEAERGSTVERAPGRYEIRRDAFSLVVRLSQ